jgi:hypothetical protein
MLRREWTFEFLWGLPIASANIDTHAWQFHHRSPRQPESRKIVVGGFLLTHLETI